MRTALRLFIFAMVVAAITLTVAPPVHSQIAASDIIDHWTRGRVNLAPLTAPPPDLSGTYEGTFTPDAPGEFPSSGTIIVRRDGDRLVVTAGPDVERQFPSEKLEREGNVMRFEVSPPGEVVRVLRFDVRIEDRMMSGTAILMRDEQKTSGRLEFTRQ